MQPYFEGQGATIYHGDCREVLAELPDASVDSVVTDPPYELGFMGKRWDASGIAYDAGLWAECLRVLKPGGHLLAFGGTRTWHRLAVAIEDAGFEIRDSIAWMYGSGFPKSLDVSKAIDKANGRRFEDRYALGRHIKERRTALGLTRADVNAWFGYRDGCEHWERQDPSGARVPTMADWSVLRERLELSSEWDRFVQRIEAEREVVERRSGNLLAVAPGQDNDRSATVLDITAPATPDAARWQGWGTALKPAHEPVVVARKPLTGTVAANVLEHGTGALNIDGCRIGSGTGQSRTYEVSDMRGGNYGQDKEAYADRPKLTVTSVDKGRWPANVVLDEDQAAALDKQSGVTTSGAAGRKGSSGFAQGYDGGYTIPYGDTGGASRFFYVAKAPARERPKVDGVAHPTVKPLTLMRWLCRLVTPPGGVVLEPFAGSGTTIEAALMEGFRVVAIEREPDYLPLIAARLERVTQEPDDGQLTFDASA